MWTLGLQIPLGKEVIRMAAASKPLLRESGAAQAIQEAYSLVPDCGPKTKRELETCAFLLLMSPVSSWGFLNSDYRFLYIVSNGFWVDFIEQPPLD